MTSGPYKVAEVVDAGDAPCACEGCDWTGPAGSTTDIESCALTPGDSSPVGRCPECDTLCYLLAPLRTHSKRLDTLVLREVMMSDLVGDYDVPEDVPEWAWVEKNASYSHRGNGVEGGVWEFIINLANDLQDIPERLVSVIADARKDEVRYILIHQGT